MRMRMRMRMRMKTCAMMMMIKYLSIFASLVLICGGGPGTLISYETGYYSWYIL